MKVLKTQIEAENKMILDDANLYEWENLKKLNTISIILIVIIIIMAAIKVIV